ncbi:MAG TPA: TRAP transporter substrate-binding protein [Dongiaceae bacterium]|nr:TRAP transporter substrate-binding protein [Dongiaceae bacterium]
MERRKFIGGAAAGLATGAALAASSPKPALADSLPEVKWRLASSFPKNLDTIYGTVDEMCRNIAAATDGKFEIRPFAAGEIVPGLQVLDAVQNGTVEAGQSASYYYVGKDPTFAFDCAVPFGLNARQQNAWMYYGGGLELMREFFKDYNIVQFPAGNTGAQMGGWFRSEIKSIDDLKGLKFRIAGIAGKVLARLGVVPQQIAGSDIYPALEKGTIDAAEWVGPYDDEKLGFYKVAKYYYYPGWWEGGPQVSIYVNAKQWDSLPKVYQAVLQEAAAASNVLMVAKYDAENMPALRRLVAQGTILKPFPRDVMEASYKAAFDLYDEIAAQNAKFKKVYEGWKQFRADEYLWFRVAENSFDNFVYAQSAKKA